MADGTLVDLRAAVAAAADVGWSRTPCALDPADLAALLDEVHRQAFEPLEPQVGPVTQAGEVWLRALPAADLDAVGRFAEAIGASVAASGVAGTARFTPNEAAAQRHGPGEGVSWHRDQAEYTVVVAILTLEGHGRFEVAGGPAWTTDPGDLVLLRAPGLGGSGPGGRLRHRVEGPRTGRRSTLTLRHNSGEPGTWP